MCTRVRPLVGVVLLMPQSLIDGEPLSRIASWGRKHQAPRVMLVTVMLSPAANGAAEATWSRRNVDAESCWQ
jgi:hypothetical protein